MKKAAKEPLISVIVPVYNVEKYVGKCLDSIIDQTYKNLEIIVIDDGSTDNSSDICKSYAKKDKRIKIVQQRNSGVSHTRNTGIELARGEYIAFIDSDDWVEQNYIETLYIDLITNSCDISMVKHYVEYNGRTIDAASHQTSLMDTKTCIKRLLYADDVDISPWGKLYKTSLFHGIRYPKNCEFEDTTTTCRLIIKSKSIYLNSIPLYHYQRFRPDSITNGTFNNRKLDLINLAHEITDQVSAIYPDLTAACNRFLMWAYLSTLVRAVKDKSASKQTINNLLTYIRKNKKQVLRDKNISKSDYATIVAASFGAKVYYFLWKNVYCRVKGKTAKPQELSPHNQKQTIVEVLGKCTFGGIEAMLLNYFSQIDRSKYNLYIITHATPDPKCKQKFEKLGFTFFQVPPKQKHPIKNLKELKKIYKRIRPDIVHCHMTLSNYAPLMVAKQCSISHRISHSHLYYPTKNSYQKLCCLLSAYFATEKVACGESAASSLYGDNNNALILHNAILLKKYTYDSARRAKIRQKLHLQEQDIVIGNVGRLHSEKNHIFLLDIFVELQKKLPHAKLLLVGDGNGDMKETIIAKIQKLGITDSVIMTGNQKTAADFYQAMDIFVLPSIREGLSLALVEAQTNGLPCVTSQNIAPESKITNLVTFVDLQKSAKDWSKIVLRKINQKRQNYTTEIRKHGYDIKLESQKLSKLYKELGSNEHNRNNPKQQFPAPIRPWQMFSFIMGYAITIAIEMLYSIPIIANNSSIISLVGTALIAIFVVSSLVKQHSNRSRILFILGVALSFCVYYISHDTTILKLTLLLFSVSYLGFKQCARIDLPIRVTFMILVIVAASLGLTNNPEFILRGSIARYTLGFAHPNSFGIYSMVIIAEKMYLDYQKQKYTKICDILIAITLTCINFAYTGSRTAYIAIAFITIIFIIPKNTLKRILKKPAVVFLIKSSFINLTIISLVAIAIYSLIENPSHPINLLLSHRPEFFNIYYRTYRFHILGHAIRDHLYNYAVLDNIYLFILIKYGILVYAILAAFSVKSIKKLIANKEFFLICIFATTLLYGLAETTIIKPGVNVFILVLSYGLKLNMKEQYAS